MKVTGKGLISKFNLIFYHCKTYKFNNEIESSYIFVGQKQNAQSCHSWRTDA